MTIGTYPIDDIVVGKDATDVLTIARDRAAKELGWKGLFLKTMSPITLGQEAVKRFNASMGTNHPIPQTAQQFLDLGKELGYITILSD